MGRIAGIGVLANRLLAQFSGRSSVDQHPHQLQLPITLLTLFLHWLDLVSTACILPYVFFFFVSNDLDIHTCVY